MLKVRPTLLEIVPYQPGKPLEELARELGITEAVKLASNENPLGPSPLAVQKLCEAAGGVNFYPDANFYELQQELSARWGVAPEALFFGNGSDELIKLLAEALLSEEEEVIIPTPSFSSYTNAAQLMGARIVTVPLRDWAMDLEVMAERITARTKLIFICNPNNPTGAMVDQAAVRRFLDRVPPGVAVVLDEAYAEYVEDPNYPDAREFLREGREIISLRTFSKIYGLAGLRIGYGLGSPGIIEALNRVRQPFPVNSLAQVAALWSLRDPRQVARSRENNATGKAFLTDLFRELGVGFVPTETNFLLILLNRPSRPIYEGLLQRGVIVRDGGQFGLPEAIRLTIGTPAENQRFAAAFREVYR